MTDWDVAYWMAKYDTLKEYCTNLECQYAAALAKIAELEDRWVFVKDRLPKDDTKVVVWFEYFRYGDYSGLYQAYGIGHYYRSEYDNCWIINGETGWHRLKVVAWTPLPEPPEENNAE